MLITTGPIWCYLVLVAALGKNSVLRKTSVKSSLFAPDMLAALPLINHQTIVSDA